MTNIYENILIAAKGSTYNMLGAVFVALLGSAYLTDVSDELAEWLSARND